MKFEPIIKEHQGVLVVRDDYIKGGSKRRFADQLIKPYREVVYASPVYGGAQIALACAGAETGVKVTIFCAKRRKPHPRTLEAKNAGATIIQVPYGYLNNVISKAKGYCAATGAHLLPFGLETPLAFDAISATAKTIHDQYPDISEVWCVGGSGVLSRSLKSGFGDKVFLKVVQVGKELDRSKLGNAKIYTHPLAFEQDAKIKPPFPSCSNYDAKVWEYIKKYSTGKPLFWNVMG
jgi:hypothetical protein